MEKIFAFVGKVGLVLFGIFSILFVGKSAAYGWLISMVCSLPGAVLIWLATVPMKDARAFIGAAFVFAGGIGMFFVNYHFARSAFWSFACLLAGLAMVSLAGGYLMAIAKGDEPEDDKPSFNKLVSLH